MPHTPGVFPGIQGHWAQADPGFLPLSLWQGTWSLDGNWSFEFPFFLFFFSLFIHLAE